MSVKITAQVWDLTLSPVKKLVLMKLADNADDFGRCFPSVKHIALKVGCSVATVQRNISQLKKDGYLKSKKRYRKDGGYMSNLYTITLENHPSVNLIYGGQKHEKNTHWQGEEVSPVIDGHTSPVQGGEVSPVIDQEPPVNNHQIEPPIKLKKINKKDFVPFDKATAAESPHKLIFNYWFLRMGKTKTAKLSVKRSKVIKDRLADGYTVEEIKTAIDNCRGSNWHMGANDRAQQYNDIELICRSAEKLERFISLKNDVPLSDRENHNMQHFNEFVNGE